MRRRAEWLERDGRGLFALWHEPAQATGTALLLLPPFAEELNKTRLALAQACAAFAGAGITTLQLDPTGCGDSEGDFGDARWDGWLADARVALAALRARAHNVIGFGVRAGALLSSALDAELDGQLWWQPVPQGKTALQQFLRLRLAAGLEGGGPRETAQELRAQLTAGETLEVAGYRLHPELAAGLEAARLQAPRGPALWLEAQREAEPALLPASSQLLAGWSGVRAQALNDAAPWAATELETCPALTAASLAWLQSA